MAPRRQSGALIAEPVAPRRNPRRRNRDRDSPLRQLIIEQLVDIPLPHRAHPKAKQKPAYQPDIVPQSSPLSALPPSIPPPPTAPPAPPAPQQTSDIQEVLIQSSLAQPSLPVEELRNTQDTGEVVKIKDGRSVNHTIAQRVQALAILGAGIALKQAAALAGLHNAQSVKRLQQKARARGYDPNISTILKSEYVCDAPRSGRPLIFTAEKEAAMLALGKDGISIF
ncbi:hypothetical protein N7G274_005209 [Stereocaulon virgatum]|uniref:DNA binding HTH domain-containing protein n=1 Tax=Stereocaulon virgatum TaxID=373712 RepID=A0ABR4AAX0_9LECA